MATRFWSTINGSFYPEPITGFEMPNLEDPNDLLTAERLVTRSPELWYQQPLPWSFAVTNLLMFPRELYLGLDAWFPSRKLAAMQEFRRGFVSPRAVEVPDAGAEAGPEVFQEASLGVVAREPLAGLPAAISGMHPEDRTFAFTVPREPLIEIGVDGKKSTPRPLLRASKVRNWN